MSMKEPTTPPKTDVSTADFIYKQLTPYQEKELIKRFNDLMAGDSNMPVQLMQWLLHIQIVVSSQKDIFCFDYETMNVANKDVQHRYYMQQVSNLFTVPLMEEPRH
jgi:hypothetical protein